MELDNKQRLGRWVILLILLFAGIVESDVAAAESGEKKHPNKLGLFGGATQESSDADVTFGLEYERLLTERLGIGGLWEVTFEDRVRTWAVAVPFYFHPYAEWFIVLAPGLEHEDGEGYWLFRTGLGYEFELGEQWSLAPELNADFVEGGSTKFVYGLALVYSF